MTYIQTSKSIILYIFKKKMKYLTSVFITLLLFSCESDSLPAPEPIDPDDLSNATIWRGETKTFTKVDNSDPNSEENQDRITSNVWITRGNSGGQIYNIISETSADSNSSPAGTRWALGTIEEISSLSFSNFRGAVGKPKNVVGKNLILHLIEDNIFLSVKFTSWSENKLGGFSYQRSTQ